MKRFEKGFTLVEMLVVAPIVVLAIGAFITVIISMTGEVLASRASNALAYSVQDAMNQIEQDVKLSTTFLAESNIPFAANSRQGFNNDDSPGTKFVNVGGSTGAQLILSMVVTNGNPLASTTRVVYLTNKPSACADAAVNANTPMLMNVVYFVKTDTSNNISSLWRRTIMPSDYNGGTSVRCTTPYQRPSCAPSITTSFCTAKDIKVVEGVQPNNFFVQYFTSANNQTANATASDPLQDATARNTALISTPTVGVSITASQNVAGKAIDRSATLRVTRLDTNASAIAAAPTQTTLSGPPTDLVATSSTGTSVTVEWDPPTGVATSYTLQYSNRSDFSSPTTINNITTLNRTVTGLTGSTVYFFRVSATNSTGTTAYSPLVLGQTTGSNPWGSYTKIATVGDWNNDGKNDLIGLRSNGDIELHLGNGTGGFGGIIALGNVGTSVRNFIGPGKLPSGTAPILYWVNSDASAYFLRSDGAFGTTGSATLSANTSTPSWGTAGTSVFAAPGYLSDGSTVIIVKSNALFIWRLNADGTPSYHSTYGSGWDSSYPGDSVFGAGRFANADAIGDIIAYNTAGTMFSYTATGTGTTSATTQISTGWTNNPIVVGGWDYSGDGIDRPDILRFYTPTPAFCLYSGNGANAFAAGGSCTVTIP